MILYGSGRLIIKLLEYYSRNDIRGSVASANSIYSIFFIILYNVRNPLIRELNSSDIVHNFSPWLFISCESKPNSFELLQGTGCQVILSMFFSIVSLMSPQENAILLRLKTLSIDSLSYSHVTR